jgi:hypothetical protein
MPSAGRQITFCARQGAFHDRRITFCVAQTAI